jgi:hypothetical protein
MEICLIGIYLLSLSIFLLISDHPVPFLDPFSDPTFRTSASGAFRNSHGFWGWNYQVLIHNLHCHVLSLRKQFAKVERKPLMAVL